VEVEKQLSTTSVTAQITNPSQQLVVSDPIPLVVLLPEQQHLPSFGLPEQQLAMLTSPQA
jgi:hypothetical protein